MIDRAPKCPVSFITAWPQVSLTIAWPLVSLTVAWPLVSWPTLDYWSVNPRFTIATFGLAWPPVSLDGAWPLISLTIAWPLVSLTISCLWACDKPNCFRGEINELGDPMSRGKIGMLPYCRDLKSQTPRNSVKLFERQSGLCCQFWQLNAAQVRRMCACVCFSCSSTSQHE